MAIRRDNWKIDHRENTFAGPRIGPDHHAPIRRGKLFDDWNVENPYRPIDERPQQFAQIGRAGAELVAKSRPRPRFDIVIDPNDPRNHFVGVDRETAEMQIDEVGRWLLAPQEDPKKPDAWTRNQISYAISTLTKPSRDQFDADKAIEEAERARAGVDAAAWHGPSAATVAATARLGWFAKRYMKDGEYHGGPWDIKRLGYQRYGKYGNVMYGYLGETSGIGEGDLRKGAGATQHGATRWQRVTRPFLDPLSGDGPEDYGFVTLGMRARKLGVFVK